MKQRVNIYFDEALHRYTDSHGNIFTSTTTVIHKYEHKKDFDKIAQSCFKAGLRGNPKYAGMSVKQIKAKWNQAAIDGCNNGNIKHNYLEDGIKSSTGFKKIKDRCLNNRLYTIDDILADSTFGELSVDDFIESGINERYPIIFNFIVNMSKQGYKIYSEVGVYDAENLISGCIDLFLFRESDMSYYIGDWKTNKFIKLLPESGYYLKDDNDNVTDIYKYTDDVFKAPISHLSTGLLMKYNLQLSCYDYLTSTYGLMSKGRLLFHIKNLTDDNNLEIVDVYAIDNHIEDIKLIINHHSNNNPKNLTLFV